MSTKLDQIDQESEVGTLPERTLFNSVQLGNPKDILMNTEAPSKQVGRHVKDHLNVNLPIYVCRSLANG